MKAILPKSRALVIEGRFQRVLFASLALHAALGAGIVWTPFASRAAPQAVAVVAIYESLPSPEPVREVTPPAAEPPKPEPPAPEPPKPDPKPVRQQVEDAVVIPQQLKPEPPKPRKAEKAEKAPQPPKKPEKPPESAADIMARLRKDYEPTDKPAVEARQEGAPGVVDPEMAVYQRAIQACMRSNWEGGGEFLYRRDLTVQFELRLDPESGRVREYKMTQGSGQRGLDASATRALERCRNQLPPPPRGMTVHRVVFAPGERG